MREMNDRIRSDDFDEEEYQKFMDWCDRMAAKAAERRRAGGVPVVSAGRSDEDITSQSPSDGPTPPLSLTSDPRYSEAF